MCFTLPGYGKVNVKIATFRHNSNRPEPLSRSSTGPAIRTFGNMLKIIHLQKSRIASPQRWPNGGSEARSDRGLKGRSPPPA